LGRTRNLALEKIADLTNFPCKYKVVGCTYSFPPQEKLAHERKCNYRQFKCPCPGSGCKWSDSKEKVVQHLANAHPSIVTLQGEDIIFLATEIDMAASMDWVMMQSCFGHHFLLVLQKQYQDPHSQYYIQVIQMGSKNEAKHFRYNLQLHAGSRKLNFQSAPKSLDDVNTADVFRKECLHFDSHLAMLFVRENNLNIAVRISVNSDDQDD
jgi:E3 ubiquitin-protein ligase SIAH1